MQFQTAIPKINMDPNRITTINPIPSKVPAKRGVLRPELAGITAGVAIVMTAATYNRYFLCCRKILTDRPRNKNGPFVY